jgi:hypothetical protein
MKDELFLIQPEPGKIIQIYLRCRQYDFLHGFCRGILHAGRYIQFLEGFLRRANPDMTVLWSEPHDFGIQRRDQFSFETTDEAPWMSHSNPQKTK